MRKNSFLLQLTFLLFLLSACSLGASNSSNYSDFVFPTPEDFFITQTPNILLTPISTRTPTQTASPTASPTPRNWPPPYWGTPGATQVTPIPTPMPFMTHPDSITFLLLGADRFTSSYRTDTIILLNFQPAYDQITMISIPRDTFVYIPGWRMQRINTAFYHGELGYYPGGGPALIKDTILYNFGIEVDYYAMVDFQGFIDIVDTIGGMELPLVCSYTDWRPIDPDGDLQDEDNWELYTIGPGVTNLDGDLALWYARSRMRSNDFDRGRRQQEILRGIFNQSLRWDTITRIPQLYETLTNSFRTDFTLQDMLSFLPYLDDLNSADLRSYYLNLDSLTAWRAPESGAYYLIPNQEAMFNLIANAMGPPSLEEITQSDAMVEIINGTSYLNWDILTAERLSYGGFTSQINISDASNHTHTILYDHNQQANSTATLELLSVLGLDASNLIHQPSPDAPFPYLLIIGSDYNPCFDPADISD